MLAFLIFLFLSFSFGNLSNNLPTLYEYYTNDGINSGLSVDQRYFTLNSKNITLYSGAMHYFRVPKPYWRDRLRKIRAAGLNTVETYISWNLHEPQSGHFDFGDGGSDMTDFLDINEFFQIVKEEDLLAIVRPGPYICAEWEFGGFPSWLLREKDINLRTSDPVYMQFVERYFNALLPILDEHQFTKNGSIIAFQVENEYGSTRVSITPDKEYLGQLRTLMLDNGIVELLFTSDSPTSSGTLGTLPEYFFQTANFEGDPTEDFDLLQKLQPGKPSMAMEFYLGWFDHWNENHHTVNVTSSGIKYLEEILEYPGSFNIYMFHGGTSFGLLNGANVANSNPDNSGYQPDTSSYDYDAPISEDGNCTEKYYAIKELLEKFNEIQIRTPEVPEQLPKTAYSSLRVQQELLLYSILTEQPPLTIESQYLVPMELLPINNNSGQSYGYIAYRKENLNLPSNSTLNINGYLKDTLLVYVNGKQIAPVLKSNDSLNNNFGSWKIENSTITLTNENLNNATIVLVVENFGRVNYGPVQTLQVQFKGLLQGEVFINEEILENWTIIPLEFKKSWTNSLSGWKDYDNSTTGPKLYKFELNIDDDPADTFIDTQNWTKGIIIVNGFVLGRHFIIGPQLFLFLPAPLLKTGQNEIIVFEHFEGSEELHFSEKPIYKS